MLRPVISATLRFVFSLEIFSSGLCIPPMICGAQDSSGVDKNINN
jgi:hypothetical protein